MNLGVGVPAIGVVADEICEVADLDISTLQKAPSIAKWKDELIIVPNMKQTFELRVGGLIHAVHCQGKADGCIRDDCRSAGTTGRNLNQKIGPNSDDELDDLVKALDAMKLNREARANLGEV